MPVTDKSCESYAFLGKTFPAYGYARMHGHYFGPTRVVLDNRVDSEGAPLSLQLTEDFLEENNMGLRLGVVREDAPEILNHISQCSTEVCRQAYERFNLYSKVMEEGVPGEIAIRCAVECGASAKGPGWAYGKNEEFNIPDKDWGKSADFFEPFFRWFDKPCVDDWVWPDLVGWPRLYGKSSVKIDLIHGAFIFNDARALPLGLIRKLEVHSNLDGSQTWFSPQVYHPDTLSDPEQQSRIDGNGNVRVWLREDADRATEVAREFAESDLGFKLRTSLKDRV